MLIDYNFDTLCMSGGGTKGLAFLGALKALIDCDILNISTIKTFIGSSMGGIICFLLATGFDVNELISFTESFKFESMNPDIDLEALFSECGLDKGDKLFFVLGKFLEQKTGKTDITLKELYELTGNKIILSTTNYTKGHIEYISYENYPNLPAILACRMSACLPLYFVPVRISEGSLLKCQGHTDDEIYKMVSERLDTSEKNVVMEELKKESIFIDGGVLDNFPIQLGNKETTLGILINNSPHEYDTESIIKFVSSIVGMVSHFMISYKLDSNKNVIHLKITNMELIKLEMSKKFKKKLINEGYVQTLESIKKSVEDSMKNIISDIINKF